ncbi:MAG TPA: 2-dehydropantoate 2-reductase [Steroidobacteraceae bacterium]|jgi:2-dehydropantoate 2-reductase|nr:2-dehydropantoate 2-reductase [Steroidobacteraceae bacterium]
MSSSVVIVGAGAIGAWLADAFDRAGWSVSMLARGATLDALRREGLRVSCAGDTRVTRPRAGTALELGVHDYVFLTVKAQTLPELAPTLTPLLGPATVVASGTNGIPWWFFHDFGGELANLRLESVDPEGSQERTFPRERILGSVVHASARVLAPADVQVVAADRLLLGAPSAAPRGDLPARLDSVVAALRAGGINALASNRIRQDVWTKLWGNMNMNPLSALTRCGTARLLGCAEVRGLCVRMMEEMQLCAERLDLRIAITAEERIGITQRLGNFIPSMLTDLEAGRPLELAPQLGAVVEIAGLLDIPVPFSRSILGLTRLIAP